MTDEVLAAIQRIREAEMTWESIDMVHDAKLIAAALLREQKRAEAAEARVRELEATQKFATEQSFATTVSWWRR